MSASRRNTLVGITMLGAMVVLAWMVFKFGHALASPFAPTQVHFRLVAERADGVSDGTAILYRGVAAGQVQRAYLHDINQVYIDASVDANPPLPGNLKATIRPNGLIGGGASIVLELSGAEPTGKLQEGQIVQADYSGLNLLPPEFTDLADELKATAAQFRQSHVIQDFDTTVNRFGQVAQSLHDVTGDAATQADLKTSLANIRQSSDDIRKFAARLDKISADAGDTLGQARQTLSTADGKIAAISQQVGDRMEQIARLLDSANAITAKVNNGQGTAGQLINDPKLYASLLDTTQEMDATVKDLKRLVEQWEQEGVSLKLK